MLQLDKLQRFAYKNSKGLPDKVKLKGRWAFISNGLIISEFVLIIQ
jgi:hypothetical protein